MTEQSILILLLEEGTNVYVRGRCVPIGEGKYRVTEVSDTFGAEPEFSIGDEITLEKKQIQNVDECVAIAAD